MSIDNMDDYAVNLADAYAKDAYQKGYEQGKKDAVKHGHWILKGFGNADCSCCGINRNINKVYYGAIFAYGCRKTTLRIDNSYVGNPALYERW